MIDRYRHNASGQIAIAERHSEMRRAGERRDTYVMHAVTDPREAPGSPFTVEMEKVKVWERRDPSGPYTPDNAVEIELDGQYVAQPLTISGEQFQAEWTAE